MTSIDNAYPNVQPIKEFFLPIPFVSEPPPSHVTCCSLEGTPPVLISPVSLLSTYEVHQLELIPPPNKRRQPVPLPLPFAHVLSSDHPVATRRLWNVLSGIDGLHMCLQQLEDMHFDPMWCTHPATDPFLDSFTIQVEADDPAVDGISFVVTGAELFRSVSLLDVFNTVHRECIAHAHSFARGGGDPLWWGGLSPGPRNTISILTLHGGSPGVNAPSLYMTSTLRGQARL